MPPRETESSWTAPVQCLSTVTGRFLRKCHSEAHLLLLPSTPCATGHKSQMKKEAGAGSHLEPPIAPITAGGGPRAWVQPTASLSTSRASCSLGQPCDLMRIYFSHCTAGQRKIAPPLHCPLRSPHFRAEPLGFRIKEQWEAESTARPLISC